MAGIEVTEAVSRWYQNAQSKMAELSIYAQIRSELVDQIPTNRLDSLRAGFGMGGATSVGDFFARADGRSTFTGTNRAQGLRKLCDVLADAQDLEIVQKLHLHTMAVENLFNHSQGLPGRAITLSSPAKKSSPAAAGPGLIDFQEEWQLVAKAMEDQLDERALTILEVTYSVRNQIIKWLRSQPRFYKGNRADVLREVEILYHQLSSFHDVDCCHLLRVYIGTLARAPAAREPPQKTPAPLKKVLEEDEPMQCFCGAVNIRYVITPCGHGLCKNCVSEQDKCISCGTKIGQFVRLAQHMRV